MLGDTVDSSITLDYPTGPGSFPSVGGGSSGTSWLNVLNTGLQATAGILGTRYAVPQLNPGQLIQTGPGGTTMYQGSGGSMLPNLNMGGSGMGTILLLGGGALLLVLAMGRKN